MRAYIDAFHDATFRFDAEDEAVLEVLPDRTELVVDTQIAVGHLLFRSLDCSQEAFERWAEVITEAGLWPTAVDA